MRKKQEHVKKTAKTHREALVAAGNVAHDKYVVTLLLRTHVAVRECVAARGGFGRRGERRDFALHASALGLLEGVCDKVWIVDGGFQRSFDYARLLVTFFAGLYQGAACGGFWML